MHGANGAVGAWQVVPFMKPEKHFWEWFVRHEAELFALRVERPEERERIFDELASQLREVDIDRAGTRLARRGIRLFPSPRGIVAE
jgi:hypothetical protein